MEETVLETFNNVKFIQGVTKMNQPNWQEYFGGALPNGVYDGFLCTSNYVYDGTVFVNGIFAKVETENGYTDIGNIGTYDTDLQEEIPPYDRFVCLRVWFNEEKAEIVQKTGFAEWFGMSNIGQYESSLLAQVEQFLMDESYGCTRNELYYDVPLYYQGVNNTGHFLRYGINLRRLVNLNKKREKNQYLDGGHSGYNRQISGSNSYRDDNAQYLYMDPVNRPDGALIFASSNITYHLETFPWVNYLSDGATSNSRFVYARATFLFAQPNLWTRSTSGDYYSISFASSNAIRITLIDIQQTTNSGTTYQRPVYLVEVLI